jgi:hypothetical protein
MTQHSESQPTGNVIAPVQAVFRKLRSAFAPRRWSRPMLLLQHVCL